MKAIQRETTQGLLSLTEVVEDHMRRLLGRQEVLERTVAVERPPEMGLDAVTGDLGRLSLRTGVPYKFAGEGEDLDAWVFKMERFFHKTGVREEEEKLDLACEGLEGIAFQYFQLQYKAGKLMSWSQLVMDLKRRFNHMKSLVQT